jgi:hypothetical protein
VIIVVETTAATTARAKSMESPAFLIQQLRMDRTGLALGCVEG